jgi:hypothetical protein
VAALVKNRAVDASLLSGVGRQEFGDGLGSVSAQRDFLCAAYDFRMAGQPFCKRRDFRVGVLAGVNSSRFNDCAVVLGDFHGLLLSEFPEVPPRVGLQKLKNLAATPTSRCLLLELFAKFLDFLVSCADSNHLGV